MVIIMPGDVLAISIARASAGMILIKFAREYWGLISKVVMSVRFTVILWFTDLCANE